MRKRLWILVVGGILIIALAVPMAYGAVSSNNQKTQDQQFFNQMFDTHQQWLDQAQEDGQVTPEQAKAWQEHFKNMRDFHEKYGNGPMESMMEGGMMGSDGGMMNNSNNGKNNGNMMGL